MEIIIWKELDKDYKIIENVVEQAFKNAEFSDHDEHNLVGRLRKSNEFIEDISMVAEVDGIIVGHIMLSKIKINNNVESQESLALAPVSVIEKYQGKGIGKELIKTALNKAKKLGYKSVIVLGHESYYPKFGFKLASSYGIKPPFEVPDEAFMALELNDGDLDGVSGIVEYSRAFLG